MNKWIGFGLALLLVPVTWGLSVVVFFLWVGASGASQGDRPQPHEPQRPVTPSVAPRAMTRQGVLRLAKQAEGKSLALAGRCLEGTNLSVKSGAADDGLDSALRRIDELNLSRASARKLNLRGQELLAPNFDGADLREAWFGDCTLEHASFVGARLEGARFDRAWLKSCHFERSELRGAVLREGQLDGGALSGTRFEDCELSEADFAGASLKNASFRGCTFQGARLGARLEYASFVDCDLRGADFSGATLQGVSFRGCRLEGVDWRAVGLHRVHLGTSSAARLQVPPERAGEVCFGRDARGDEVWGSPDAVSPDGEAAWEARKAQAGKEVEARLENNRSLARFHAAQDGPDLEGDWGDPFEEERGLAEQSWRRECEDQDIPYDPDLGPG